MLIQVDGWSGSGKSVLMYLLDGHPELYSHPFHDLLQFLFRKPSIDDEWLKHKDVWQLRQLLSQNTLYYRTESFIRQSKYIVEFKSDVHLPFSISQDFTEIDRQAISRIISNDIWTPESLLVAIYSSFQQNLMPTPLSIQKFVFMGGWRGKDNLESFSQVYPNTKQLVIKRDIKDIIAIQSGRKPNEIDYRSKNYNNRSVQDILNRGEVDDYFKYYRKLEAKADKFPDRVMVLEFEHLINDRETQMKRVCEFLEIKNLDNWSSSFLGNEISHGGTDYSESILDTFEDLLTKEEIKEIDKLSMNTGAVDSGIKFGRLKSFLKVMIEANIKASKKIISRL